MLDSVNHSAFFHMFALSPTPDETGVHDKIMLRVLNKGN